MSAPASESLSIKPVTGYFAIGAEGISKPMNLGNPMRSARAFGASFIFTVGAHSTARRARPDTSKAPHHLPHYAWDTVAEMQLPKDCRLVGVELTEDAIDLPSFRHPSRTAHLLGRERGSLSPQMLEGCEFVVGIPTAFCINLATAGAIIMYDRLCTLGSFAERPVRAGGPMPPRRP